MSRDYSAVIPCEVEIRWLGRRCYGTPASTNPAYYTKTVTIASAGIITSQSGFAGTKNFNDWAVALYGSSSGPPTNQSNLDALATQVAKDYYRWQSVAFDIDYDGIAAPDPNGLVDEVRWSYTMDGAETRIRTAEYNGDPKELCHWDPAVTGCVDSSSTGLVVAKTPCLDYYGPPAICTSGVLSLTRYNLCKIDGRNQYTYVSTDVVG